MYAIKTLSPFSHRPNNLYIARNAFGVNLSKKPITKFSTAEEAKSYLELIVKSSLYAPKEGMKPYLNCQVVEVF